MEPCNLVCKYLITKEMYLDHLLTYLWRHNFFSGLFVEGVSLLFTDNFVNNKKVFSIFFSLSNFLKRNKKKRFGYLRMKGTSTFNTVRLFVYWVLFQKCIIYIIVSIIVSIIGIITVILYYLWIFILFPLKAVVDIS